MVASVVAPPYMAALHVEINANDSAIAGSFSAGLVILRLASLSMHSVKVYRHAFTDLNTLPFRQQRGTEKS